MEQKDKKFYWIKLKENFMTSDKVDFLMSQKEGANYVVLYQMLCLKTINTNGLLAREIGEILIQYDPEKIARDTKWFTIDTVRIALELYKKLGLIYLQDDGILQIANFDNLIGSECSSAQRVREYREKQQMLQCNTKVTQENRDKSIDIDKKENNIQDKSYILKEKKLQNQDFFTDFSHDNEKKHRFTPPTVEEISQYCQERANNVDANKFYDFYKSKDWFIGKNKMKDWKAAVRTWERTSSSNNKSNNQVTGTNPFLGIAKEEGIF